VGDDRLPADGLLRGDDDELLGAVFPRPVEEGLEHGHVQRGVRQSSMGVTGPPVPARPVFGPPDREGGVAESVPDRRQALDRLAFAVEVVPCLAVEVNEHAVVSLVEELRDRGRVLEDDRGPARVDDVEVERAVSFNLRDQKRRPAQPAELVEQRPNGAHLRLGDHRGEGSHRVVADIGGQVTDRAPAVGCADRPGELLEEVPAGVGPLDHGVRGPRVRHAAADESGQRLLMSPLKELELVSRELAAVLAAGPVEAIADVGLLLSHLRQLEHAGARRAAVNQPSMPPPSVRTAVDWPPWKMPQSA
jgi:hypothetical protein